MTPQKLASLLLLIATVGCHRVPDATAVQTAIEFEACNEPGLHNVFKVSDTLYSGSEPESGGFASLRQLGIRTIISVDGSSPDAEAAKAFGLRYVHLPIGYDGISRTRLLELGRAVRDLPGPVYVHCHHGKHRGPAACAAIQMTLANWDADTALHWMSTAGTDPVYQGLIGLPKSFAKPTEAELNSVVSEFPAKVQVADFTQMMVDLDRLNDHLKLAEASGWQAPPLHHDLDPKHEAVQLHELYRETLRLKPSPGDEDFLKRLNSASQHAKELDEALQKADKPSASRLFKVMQNDCKQCHAVHRVGAR